MSRTELDWSYATRTLTLVCAGLALGACDGFAVDKIGEAKTDCAKWAAHHGGTLKNVIGDWVDYSPARSGYVVLHRYHCDTGAYEVEARRLMIGDQASGPYFFNMTGEMVVVDVNLAGERN